MPKPITNPAGGKPAKPRPDFPLFPHATKRWAKKIRGKLYYFGPWDDPNGALQDYLDQKDDLYAGRTPRATGDGLTIRDLVNHFLTAKRHQLDTKEITERTFRDYYATCDRIVAVFSRNQLVKDLGVDDFQRLRANIAKRWGAVALGNEVQRVRVVFKYAYDAALIHQPMRYGPTFKRPSQRVLRKARQERAPRMFEPHELRTIIDAAPSQLRAMVLLGINCAYGNHDVASLPQKCLDLAASWATYARPKTGVERRCPLWPETVAALQAAIADRPKPRDPADADLVFITKYGQRWSGAVRSNPISAEFRKLLRTLGLYRPGLSFYALRHTFETVGGGARDQVAVDAIMGHCRNDMASLYRERIEDSRLRAVTDHVRSWLFPDKADTSCAALRRTQ